MARKGEGFPLLVVCAFAFGPYVGEETRQWPNLTILTTRMNPDLAMDTADQKLLKSTGAGNLFMVFGEPDLELRTLPDGKLQVELRGLDVYDPTSGEIRSSSTDDIACWFIDSDYNEESFFVRHGSGRFEVMSCLPRLFGPTASASAGLRDPQHRSSAQRQRVRTTAVSIR